MGSKGDYLESAGLNHFLGGPDLTRPASLWMALYTVIPTDTGGGTEVAAGSYNRVEFSNSTNFWTFASTVGGSKTNKLAITFPAAGAGGWGTIVGWALWTVSDTGNLFYWGSMTTSKAVGSGDIAKFNTGAIVITED